MAGAKALLPRAKNMDAVNSLYMWLSEMLSIRLCYIALECSLHLFICFGLECVWNDDAIADSRLFLRFTATLVSLIYFGAWKVNGYWNLWLMRTRNETAAQKREVKKKWGIENIRRKKREITKRNNKSISRKSTLLFNFMHNHTSDSKQCYSCFVARTNAQWMNLIEMNRVLWEFKPMLRSRKTFDCLTIASFHFTLWLRLRGYKKKRYKISTIRRITLSTYLRISEHR